MQRANKKCVLILKQNLWKPRNITKVNLIDWSSQSNRLKRRFFLTFTLFTETFANRKILTARFEEALSFVKERLLA